MRTVFVGIDPGERDGESSTPLDPTWPSGARLAKLIGLSHPEFVRRFDRVNLHPSPGTSEKEDRRAASNLLPLLRGRRVVALGLRVAEAIGTPSTWFGWSLVRAEGDDGFVGTTVPHPSGLSRWWNSSDNVGLAREFLSHLVLPCVHVEGTDGSGKTTLVKDVPEEWTRMPTEDPPMTWEECLSRIGKRLFPGMVCDRSSGLVSELVYGPVLRGRTIVREEVLWNVVRSVAGAIKFVYCRPDELDIRPSFRKGEDPKHVELVKSRGRLLLARYDEVVARMERTGCQVVRYDRSPGRIQEIFRCAE